MTENQITDARLADLRSTYLRASQKVAVAEADRNDAYDIYHEACLARRAEVRI